MQKFLVIVISWLVIQTALAEEVKNTAELTSTTQNTTINSTITGTAQDWNLTTDEWGRYLKLMQGQNGKWYPQLTPPAVLGLNAESPEEQKHFAEIVAKEEHDKLARELAFDSAVHQALLRLYLDEPVIKGFDLSPFNPVQPSKTKNNTLLQTGDHLVLFTDPSNGLDSLLVPQLISIVQKNSGIILDVYCVGNGDDNAIRSWAKFNHIPQTFVSSGRITLNHDNGKLQKSVGNAQLPYLVLARNGQSQPVSVWNLS